MAVPAVDVERFPVGTFTRHAGHTTQDAVRLIETSRPRVVVVDWDSPDIEGVQVCAMARKFSQIGILMVTADTTRVPAALKAGCHAVLLKPLAPSLVATRVGRLARELSSPAVTVRSGAPVPPGTNRVWPGTPCPKCSAANAVSFEFHSYRRMWYACLGCEYVWLGPRQE